MDKDLNKVWMRWIVWFPVGFLMSFFVMVCQDSAWGKPIVWPNLLIRPFVHSSVILFLIMVTCHYQWQKQHQPDQLSKERFTRYLPPLVGIGLTLFLWSGFYAGLNLYVQEFLRHSTDIGFKAPPFTNAALNPFILPACGLGVTSLFVGAILMGKDQLRAVLAAIALIALVVFAIYWTTTVCAIAHLVSTMPGPPAGT